MGMTEQKPTLVIVNGPSAAGKTEIVEHLAQALGLPFFTKDDIKERFADALGEDVYDLAHELGKGSQLQLVAIAAELIRTGRGVVIESFFHKGVSEPELAPLVEQANTVVVHLSADHDELVKRYAERMDTPDRHEIHNAEGKPDELRRLLQEGVADPLDLDCPVIMLDTTDGDPDGDEVVRMIREKLGQDPLTE
jgi:shikimate kinase